MSHTWQGYKLRFRPQNPIFHSFTGFYFVSFFFEHPVFPSTKCDQNIVGFGNMNWNRLDFFIHWTKVDEKSDIIFCQSLLGFISCSLLSLDERRTDGLDCDVVVLGDEEDALVREVVHQLLLEPLEVMFIAGDSDFTCRWSL